MPSSEYEIARLTIPLLRSGLVTAQDATADPDWTPSALLETAWERHVTNATRSGPNGCLDVSLGLQPWSARLVDNGVAVRRGDEHRLCVTINAGCCVVVPLGEIRREWGKRAAGIIAAALHRGLGSVVNVWGPDDLSWTLDSWSEAVDLNDPEEAAFIREQIRAYKKTQRAVERLHSSARTRQDVVAALRTLPPGNVRRSVAALLSTSRAPRPVLTCRLWNRAYANVPGYSTAAVLVTAASGDVVHDVYDDLQNTAAQVGIYCPHGLVVLDTRSPSRLTSGARQLFRVLRTLSWGERLLEELCIFHDGP